MKNGRKSEGLKVEGQNLGRSKASSTEGSVDLICLVMLDLEV